MAAQQISIASTVPIGMPDMPFKQLRDKGDGDDRSDSAYRSLSAVWPRRYAGSHLYAQLETARTAELVALAALATGDVMPNL